MFNIASFKLASCSSHYTEIHNIKIGGVIQRYWINSKFWISILCWRYLYKRNCKHFYKYRKSVSKLPTQRQCNIKTVLIIDKRDIKFPLIFHHFRLFNLQFRLISIYFIILHKSWGSICDIAYIIFYKLQLHSFMKEKIINFKYKITIRKTYVNKLKCNIFRF